MTGEIDVVCWKWKPKEGYRSMFASSSVNTLRNMVSRHLRVPHRFSCVTDDTNGIDPDIRTIPLWIQHANIPNPSSAHNPSCYRRLKIFSREAADLFGRRIVSIDLDMVIVDDITPIFDCKEDFRIWDGQRSRPEGGRLNNCYNGSLVYLRAGTRPKVWDDFNPAVSPGLASRNGCRGSDQGWISYKLGTEERTWGLEHGIFSYRNDVLPKHETLPRGARIVAFHGRHDPWDDDVQKIHPWVREHYR